MRLTLVESLRTCNEHSTGVTATRQHSGRAPCIPVAPCTTGVAGVSLPLCLGYVARRRIRRPINQAELIVIPSNSLARSMHDGAAAFI